MNERLVFILLLCAMGVLWYIIGCWRRKAGEVAFAAARMAEQAEERDRYCRLAVMAGHRDACRMFCFSRPDLFEDHPPLKPFKSRGIRMTFYGYYYPSRHKAFINDEQRTFSRSIYRFKEGKIHGIEFFKACMEALQMDGKPYHVMFMPCSTDIKYFQRFKWKTQARMTLAAKVDLTPENNLLLTPEEFGRRGQFYFGLSAFEGFEFTDAFTG